MKLNDKRLINAWCFFDWANSAYSLVITTAVFPIYYSAVVEQAFGGRQVPFLGMYLDKGSLYSYAISFSFLLIAALSPVLSGVADYSGRKKSFMRFFTTMGALACLSLFFFTGQNVGLGIGASVVASIGYAGALVFYNAYLPEIVSQDRLDSVSARGFSFGYLGSVLLLMLNLAMIQFPQHFGLADSGMATRLAFVSVSLWWLGFSQITFSVLPNRHDAKPISVQMLTKGFHELQKVWRQLQGQAYTQRFLVAFFLYNTGVQTTIYLASLFGTDELKLGQTQLIGTILLLQLLGILGAYTFAKISDARGNRFALSIVLCIWVAVCIGAFFIGSATEFYLMAAGVGLVMGGVQSLSRATYSKLLPEGTPDTASYFSFYDVLDKCSTVLGTFIYGLVIALSGGSMRNSALVLSVFFVAGLMVLQGVRVGKR